MVDLHTHILPGIDDGARSMDDALEMARVALDDGITTMVATPHAYWEGEVNTGPTIRGALGEVTRELEKAGLPLTLVPGAEVPIQRNLVELLQIDPSWTIGGRSIYLLLEPPWSALPEYTFTLVQDLVAEGITPVIAHPERNPDLQSNLSLVDRMLQMGSLVQVTANSLIGKHGSTAQKSSLRMLETGRVHVISSDAHNARNRAPVLSQAREEISGIVDPETLRRLFEENPRRIVDGEPIERLDPPEPEPQRQGPIKGLFSRLLGR